MENIGEKILKLRKLSRKSQEELGFNVGVTRQTISKWESGAMIPSVENLKALSIIFGVSSEFFLSDDSKVEIQIIANDDILNNSILNNEEGVVALAIDKQENKTKPLIFGLILNGLAFIIFLFFTVIIGRITFTDNTGYRTVQTSNLDLSWFIILLIMSVVCCMGEMLLLFKMIRKKANVTCK